MRQAFDDSGLTIAQAAAHCGYLEKGGTGDVIHFKRRLGWHDYYSRGKTRFQTHLLRPTAVHIIRSIGLDPIDYGL